MALVIRKRPSNGRGEYELAGEDGSVRAQSLVGRRFILSISPGLSHDTHTLLQPDSGKLRFRIEKSGAGTIQIARQIAAYSMLPKPTRDESRAKGHEPIVLANRYLLDTEIAVLDLVDGSDTVTVRPTRLDARSAPLTDLTADFTWSVPSSKRQSSVEWAVSLSHRALFKPSISAAILNFEAVRATGTSTSDMEKAVLGIMDALDADPDIPYNFGPDPLAALIRFIRPSLPTSSLREEQLGTLPDSGLREPLPNPELIPSDLPEIRERAKRDRRLQQDRRRDTKAQKLSRDIYAAYRGKCLFCGLYLPQPRPKSNRGVQSAHILAWGKYELDDVRNGILLCPNHHWAFDEDVLRLRHSANAYSVVFNEEVAAAFEVDAATLTALRAVCGPVPTDRLPANPDAWPAPEFLDMYYA